MGDFPSWEREVSASDQDPLPLAQQGEFEVALSVKLAGAATGVVHSPRGGFVTALSDGSVEWRDCGGELRVRHDVGSVLTQPPLVVGADVIVTGPAVIARVGEGGVAWRHALDAPPVTAAAAEGDQVFVATSAGAQLHSAADGALAWKSPVAGITAGPAWMPAAILLGTAEGELVALDRASGAAAWRKRVGHRVDSVSSVGGSGGGVFFAGYGPSRRSRADVGPFVARVECAPDGLAFRSVPWLLRTGAACPMPPLLLDGLVAFACHDGFVHAVHPRKGSPGWRADVPARVKHVPAQAGGRLDFALSPTRWLVSLSAENGAVMGWTALGDEDETFTGPAATCGDVTLVATSFDRVVALRWKPGEQPDVDASGISPRAITDRAIPDLVR